ncbi:MAG TPA: HAMP domain-containing sensor histidine kinase [Candidatus Dormibacteraeota bacterium]|nr:HAMP domain-containing sensor histidine kinase [Candidatus Dormibacteraeota bacterium]
MATVLRDFTVAIQIAFFLLAVGTLTDWIRHRDRQRTFLVLALLFLTLLVLITPINAVVNLPAQVVTDLGLVVFLLSGYFLLLFRDSLIPLGSIARRLITAEVAVVAVAAVLANFPSGSNAARSPFQLIVLAAVIVTWVLCVGEPIIRLGLASIDRPAVEGARLRALSLGYAGLIAVILVAVLAGPRTRDPNVAVAIDAVVLLVVPLLYASFSPPTWLRRLWSQPEEDEIRRAIHDLLLYSPDRTTLARRALDWGARLVGGAAAFIVDSDGTILATRGITVDEAARSAATPTHDRSTLLIPLDLEQGRGTMIILSGPFTPVFGEYEVSRLKGYAVSITAGLDRVSLTGRIAALEKAKTEFLNIASHELRGPMTVIKGYLTMLAAGSLGDIPPRAMSVMPLLIAKSDEVNSLLEQMIEASRLEDGKLALKRERNDIVELTEAAIETLEPLLTGHEFKFEKPAQPIWAKVDPDRFQIVVRNLVSNAIKYSPTGAHVTVRIKPNGNGAALAVIDQGIGIAAQDQAKLFTRFGRIENQATMHTSGTGLGLWLSREIARMHDGDLTLDSEEGRGSTFTMEIPLDRS